MLHKCPIMHIIYITYNPYNLMMTRSNARSTYTRFNLTNNGENMKRILSVDVEYRHILLQD